MKSLRLMFAAMVMMAVGTANAQWKPSNTDYTRIDKPGATGQKLMKTLRTDDGKIIMPGYAGRKPSVHRH